MKFKTTLKRTVAATVLAGLATIGLASAAVAADDPTQITGSTGSIEVTKYFQQADGTTADGSTAPTTTPPSPVVQGVKYKLTRVTVWDGVTFNKDTLDKNTTWEKITTLADGLKANNASPAWNSGTTEVIKVEQADTPATSAEGKIKWEGLELGVYVLEEVSVTGAKVKGDGNADKVLKVDDTKYLITVPMTDKNGTAWNYNIKVFPKNKEGASLKPTKTVSDARSVFGDEVSYTVDVPVPNNETYTDFKIIDQATSGLEYVADSLSVKLCEDAACATSTALAATTDYTLTAPDSNNKNLMTIDFVKDSADHGVKLLDAKKGLNTKIQLTAKYKVVGTNANQVNRVASIPGTTYGTCFKDVDNLNTTAFNDDPNNNCGDKPTPPTTYVTTKMGGFTIVKKDGNNSSVIKNTKVGDNPGTYPNAAKFNLYYCDKDATQVQKWDPAANDNQGGWVKGDEAIDKLTAINGATVEGTTAAPTNKTDEFTTDENGKVTVSGLQVPSFVNNATVQEKDQFHYCLKEIKAPQGYQISQTLIPVSVNEYATNAFGSDQDVKNYKGPNLPLTGSQALALTMIAGVLLTAGATFVLIRRRRVQG